MKVLGRFVFRGMDSNDGLIIGSSFKGHDFFLPNTVYEITDWMGQIVLRPVGESIVARTGETYHDSPVQRTWGSSFDQLVLELGPELLLTREEYAEIKKKRVREWLVKEFSEEQVAQWESEGKDLNEIQY